MSDWGSPPLPFSGTIDPAIRAFRKQSWSEIRGEKKRRKKTRVENEALKQAVAVDNDDDDRKACVGNEIAENEDENGTDRHRHRHR